MNGWTGCGECDSSFDCHEGRERCIRLRPRYFVLRAPPGRCEDCKAVAAEGRFEVPWVGITGANEGMTVCAACKPKYLEGVDFVELESPCPKHSRDGIAWCREPRCAECPMSRKGAVTSPPAARSPQPDFSEPAASSERPDFCHVPDFYYRPTSARDAYLRRWRHNEAVIDRALEGTGLVARDLMAEALRVSGVEVPPEVYSHGPYSCGSCRDTGVWSTGIVCPVCSVYGPQQPGGRAASNKQQALELETDPRCPECKYDHDKEGPGAACLRHRTDQDLIRECSRRWAEFADLFTLLYDLFDLCIDLGEPLDGAIAQRVLGPAQGVAVALSLRSRRFLADTVRKYPWLSERRKR